MHWRSRASLKMIYLPLPPLLFYQIPSYSITFSLFCDSSHHLNSLWVKGFDEDSATGGHALHELVQRSTFDLFPFQVGDTVQKVKKHTTLLQLLTEQVMKFCHWSIWGTGRRGDVIEYTYTLKYTTHVPWVYYIFPSLASQ